MMFVATHGTSEPTPSGSGAVVVAMAGQAPAMNAQNPATLFQLQSNVVLNTPLE